ATGNDRSHPYAPPSTTPALRAPTPHRRARAPPDIDPAHWQPGSSTLRLSRRRASNMVRLEPAVAPFLELERQLLAARARDAAVSEDMNEIGHDVVQQPLIVGHHENRALRRAHRRYASGDDLQRVDVEARVGLVGTP